MPDHTRFPIIIFFLAFLTGCAPLIPSVPTSAYTPTALPSQTPLPSWIPSLTLQPLFLATETDLVDPSESLDPPITPTPMITATPTDTPLPDALSLDPLDWEHWPIIPIVPEHAREIYLLGQSLGNDPHAFSVLGDCQSEPDVFMGAYETDPDTLALLPQYLQQTVTWFSGSFNRPSPTVRSGTTTAALLWPEWHQNKLTCTIYESPLQCELRIHKPSFAIIHVGTHYESRNETYMRSILDQLIAAGVVPILASKADNRELDDHVNSEYAQLAVEYDIPFWNFWAAVDGLPNRGLYTKPAEAFLGDIYLTDQAAAIHRLSALQALDTVWRAVTGRN